MLSIRALHVHSITPSIAGQFEQAGLNPWNSRWSNVHDFNHSADEKHWSFLPEVLVHKLCLGDSTWSHVNGQDTTADSLIPALTTVTSEINADELKVACPVPLTFGSRPRQKQETCVVIIFCAQREKVLTALQNEQLVSELLECCGVVFLTIRCVCEQDSVTLIRTLGRAVNSNLARQVFPDNKLATAAAISGMFDQRCSLGAET